MTVACRYRPSARRPFRRLALLGALSTLLTAHPAAAQVVQGSQAPLGLNVDFNEQSYVDFIHSLGVNCNAGADTNGWPQGDFTMALDNRYFFAWFPTATNIDPLKKSTDLSGTYKLSFTGQGKITDTYNPIYDTTLVTNQQYDPNTNTTTADINFTNPSGGPGEFQVFLSVSNTQRTPGSGANTGVTNLHLIRPGYTPGTSQIFSNLWLNSVQNYNWSALRFMGVLGTNSYGDQSSTEAYPYTLNWATDRALPGAGPLFGSRHLGAHGMPWEYVLLIANQSGKDIWINVPVNVSDDYVTQLANLLKNGDAFTGNVGLKPGINIYLEYSNELWHGGFSQGPWHKAATQAELNAGGSNLNYDGIGSSDPNSTGFNVLRMRRIAKRTVEIGKQFRAVFSDNPSRVRPIINNAFTGFTPDMLTYVTKNYGPPSQFLYGIAQTGYYGSSDTSSVDAILNGEKASSDANHAGYLQSRAIATFYGLHSLAYEGGQSETGSGSVNGLPSYGSPGRPEAGEPTYPGLPNQFAAARDPRMQDVEFHDLDGNWYPSGGELYMQFSHAGRYSVYGMWGLTDDLTNLLTGKWNGMVQIMSTPTPAVVAGGALPATVGQSANIAEASPPNTNFSITSDAPWQELLVNASVPGTYTLALSGHQGDARDTQQVWVDNKLVGTDSLPTASDGPGSNVTLTLVPGLHSVFVYAQSPNSSYNNPFDIGTQPGDSAKVTLTAAPSGVTAAPRLVPGQSGLFRDGVGGLTITLPILNLGQSTAGTVKITSLKFGNATIQVPALPDALGDIGAGGRAPVAITISHPPASGQTVLLMVRGSYVTGGMTKTFSIGQYIHIP